VEQLLLSAEEFAAESALVEPLAATFGCVEDEAFLAEAAVRAHELPERVRRFLHRFRVEEWGACVIAGHPIDDAALGPTPAHWRDRVHPSPGLAYEMLVILYTSLLGEVFGWATQQDGHLVHEVFPIRDHRLEQLGTGSEVLLTWHTEDAFHPARGDYLVLACLRNHDRVPTILGCVDDLELDAGDVKVLFGDWFTIRPDESHTAKNNTPGPAADFAAIDSMTAAPARLSVLFGDPSRPYIRADPYFMDEPPDPVAAEALRRLIAEMDRRLQHVALDAGEFLFVDNYKVVHGREPFRAHYDGTDRWLKRVNVARDLRKSLAYRTPASSRIVG
jgi:Fe(II)/alpha-ketoglutarate-dependent arginine beta-hydroxylase